MRVKSDASEQERSTIGRRGNDDAVKSISWTFLERYLIGSGFRYMSAEPFALCTILHMQFSSYKNAWPRGSTR